MSDNITSVNELKDVNNFGEWLVKINEIIDILNSSKDLSLSLEEILGNASSAGQIGNKLTIINDFNECIDNGVYYSSPLSLHSPEEGVLFNLYVASNNSNNVSQFAISVTSGKVDAYYRSRNPGTESVWTAWAKVLTTANADNTFLKLDGGTIDNLTVTNNLTVNGHVYANDNLTVQNKIDFIDNESVFTIKNEDNSSVLSVDGIDSITIDNTTGLCSIKGNIDTADKLNKSGLTDDYLSADDTLAASGKAVSDLYTYVDDTYMPLEGGKFSGIVEFKDNIVLGDLEKATPITVYALDDLCIHPQQGLSIVYNNAAAEVYLDRDNEPRDPDLTDEPVIYGARTRTGTTTFNRGTLVYGLGSLEFKEENTTLRLRKKNLSTLEDDKSNIAVVLERDSFRPSDDSKISLGSEAFRFDQVYSSSSSISSSDANLKTDIQNINENDELLKSWENVQWRTFKFKDAVEEKGSQARIHAGLIAQDLMGIENVSQYGFFCYDKWDDQFDTEYVTTPEKIDQYGNVIQKEETKKISVLKRKAGNQYSLRYQEIQAIENAYLRNEIKNLKYEIEKLKDYIKSK